jgi:glycosyltransferase involved in cell wall biosynthesis
LRALAQLPEAAWTLDVLGDGPLLEDLERLATDLGIANRVNFRGFVSDPLPYLKAAHALVLSSAWEGQGAVLVEALACGCPVIATRSTDAVAGVLGGGKYGRLVSPGDSAALTAAIAAELGERTRLPASTRQWVERYRVDAGARSHAGALGLNLRQRRH